MHKTQSYSGKLAESSAGTVHWSHDLTIHEEPSGTQHDLSHEGEFFKIGLDQAQPIEARAGTSSRHPILGSPLTEILAKDFVSHLPEDPKIQAVFWAFEKETLRIWTIITEPDLSLENEITGSQLKFIDQYPNLEYDFSVIYSFGKDIKDLHPDGSLLVEKV